MIILAVLIFGFAIGFITAALASVAHDADEASRRAYRNEMNKQD